MAFTQEEVDLCKQKLRSHDESPPYMKVRFELEDGTTQSIEAPFVYKIKKSNAFNQIGRASIEIMSVNGKYNYKLDTEWQGVLNKRHQKIEIIEGIGDWRETTFRGYITHWSMEGDGESEIVVKLECVNKLLDVNKSVFKGMGLEDDKTLDELTKDIFDQAQYQNDIFEGNDPSDENYEPSFDWEMEDYTPPEVDYADEDITTFEERWDFVGSVKREYGNSEFIITKSGIVIQAEADHSEDILNFKAYDVETWEEKTDEFQLRNISHDLNDLPNYFNSGNITLNTWDNKVAVVGSFSSAYSSGLGTHYQYYNIDKVTILDLQNKEHYTIPIPGGNRSESLIDCAFSGNELYVKQANTIYKVLIDFNGKNSTISTLTEEGNGGKLYIVGNSLISSTADNTQYFNLETGNLEDEIQNGLDGNIGMYNGYILSMTGNYYQIAHPTLTELYQTYTYNFPEDSPYRYGKSYAVHKTYIYMFPKSTTTSGDYNYTIFRTKVRFSNNGPVLADTDDVLEDYINDLPDYEPPKSENIFKEIEQQMPEYNMPSEIPSLSLLQDVTNDAGRYLYSPSHESQILSVYPTVKSTPDYTFESHVDTISLKHNISSEIYDAVRVHYGRGENAGIVEMFRTENIYPGQGGSVHKITKPHLNREQARNYARRVIANGLSEELEVAARAVPNLTIGMTALQKDNRMVGDYKGVVMQEETDNDLENGFYAKWKLLKFEG